jgi:allantoin racemase
MRFLLHNPNSNAALTADLAKALGERLGPGDVLGAETAAGAPAYIGSDETIIAARQGLAEVLPRGATAIDAIIVGCFGDLRLGELQRAATMPILSFWDAYLLGASETAERFGIVTTSAFWVERMRDDAERAGVGDRTIIRAIDVPPTSPAEELAGAIGRAAQGLQQEGADLLVLGGAILMAAAPKLVPDGMQLVDLYAASLRFGRTGKRFITP